MTQLKTVAINQNLILQAIAFLDQFPANPMAKMLRDQFSYALKQEDSSEADRL